MVLGGGADTSIVTASAADVVKGKVIVGPNGEPITGTLELSGNAGVGDVLKGKTFYSNGLTKQTGTMESMSGGSYRVLGTENQTISCTNKKMTSDIIIKPAKLEYTSITPLSIDITNIFADNQKYIDISAIWDMPNIMHTIMICSLKFKYTAPTFSGNVSRSLNWYLDSRRSATSYAAISYINGTAFNVVVSLKYNDYKIYAYRSSTSLESGWSVSQVILEINSLYNIPIGIGSND